MGSAKQAKARGRTPLQAGKTQPRSLKFSGSVRTNHPTQWHPCPRANPVSLAATEELRNTDGH